MTEHKLVLPRAEEVLPALREGAALLPGCRDRQSRPLIFIPSKEQSVNGDSFRNVLLYLYEATAHDARENGTVIVIDMRGKQPSSNLKIFLKAVDDLCGQANVHSVLVIKPEKFWDNKKAQLSTGSTKFEIQWIAYEQLVRFVDVTQIPKELGGAYPYNHSEWLQARIELERWIWKVISILKGLEEQRKLCESDQSFGDVSSVKRLIDGHNVVRERILNLCPVDVILAEHNNVSLLIQNPQNGVHNPDLMASLPHMKTLQDRIATIKEEVFHVWKERYEKLESVYQYKLYEQDAEEKLRWMQKHTDTLTQTMSNIGSNETEAGKFQREFDDIEKAVRNSDVTIEQLTTRSGRLKSTGTPHRSKVDRTDQRVREEWERLKLMLIKRRTIVTCSVAFFRCLGNYNSRYRTWLEHPGIDATRIDSKNTAQLDQAIQNHQEFWNQVEGVYAEAVQKASELKQHLRAVNATDGHQAVGQRVQDLGRAQKQLHEVWRKNKVKLHSMLALTAFHSDTQRVLEWLNEHGDPYLTRNIRIGDTEDQAKQLQRNHEQFRRIAENTYGHMEKLFEASNMIAESGVTDSEEMRTLLEALEARMGQFRSKCDLRKAILDHSLLFHIHFNEITVWYTNIEAKYGQRVVSSDLNDSEAAKEEWVVENDATAEAFATTMGDGTTLLNNLQAYQQNFGVDYSQVTSKVLDMIKRVEDSNARFVNRWSVQRQILDMSCNYASFIRDVREVLNQISSWEQDMRGMIDSPTFLDNAYKVKPFHEDNYIKVKDAVGQIKNISKELLQAIHGNQLTDLKTREGHLVVTVIQDNTKVLDRAEKQVTQLAQETSDRIEHALRYNQLCKSANEVIRSYKELESQMYEMGAIPDKLQDSHLAAEKHAKFKATLEKAGPSKTFFDRANDLLMSNKIPREYITELNEMVTNGWRRLCALTEERHKLLHTAVMYYKTTDSLGPILDQLERMCATPSQHICNRQFPEMDLEETANQVSCDISKHEEWKEKFVKSFLYAQKTSDSFIKYIQRWASDKNAREINQRIRDVQDRKAALRERQSRIFQMWTEKKKNLESCRIFVLFEASMKKNMDWLEGEGRAQLNRFQGHAKQQLQNGQKDSILEDFSLFKITVKERRATIQTLLTVSKDFLADSLEHRLDMEKGMAQIRDRFEQFSRTVADCEATLRGGRPPGSKDELSLDRNSDHSVGERIESAGTVVSKEMKKMRKPVEELIQTEREYVKDLQKCVEVYIQEFDSAAANLPLPLRGRRAEIFINIEEIFEFHSKIFLNELLKYENDPEAVGCSFTFHVDCLSRLYTKYCSVMDINTRKDIMILPETLAFFGQLREKHKIESLDSMLIKPVQRITRYTMMIRELLKMTETLVHADSSLQHNIEEIRDAYEVVLSLPKRANDIMHLNELDKDKLNVTGEFVMQDTLTVWDSKSYIKKSKERQVFLFELAIVVAKKMDMPSKSVRYLPKGKPILLNSITVVEHVENDVCRFGIRIGNESSNDNRIDFKAKDEKEKIAWVKRIRENRAGLSVNLEAGWENRSLGSNSNGTGAATHRSSKISSASSDRHSRDAESISSNEQRNSIHSCGSNEDVEKEETREDETTTVETIERLGIADPKIS